MWSNKQTIGGALWSTEWEIQGKDYFWNEHSWVIEWEMMWGKEFTAADLNAYIEFTASKIPRWKSESEKAATMESTGKTVKCAC